MTIFSVLGVAALLLVGGMFFGLFGRSQTVRTLNEFGQVTVPKALESRKPDESKDYAFYPFERASNSILMMGSNVPMVEKMVIGVWKPAARDYAHQTAREGVQYRTDFKEVTWRSEGAYDIGEAVQHVNTHDLPVWMVAKDSPEKGVTVAYMVWKSEASLDKARATVDAVLASVKPAAPIDEYLAKGEARPGLQREARFKNVQTALTAHGIQAALDAGPIEKDGIYYELYTDPMWGRLLSVFATLGELPPQEDYRWVNGNAPAPFYNWLAVVWFARKDGGFQMEGMYGNGRTNGSPAMLKKLTSPPGRGFAVEVAMIDELDIPEVDLDRTLGLAAKMAELHRSGQLIKRYGELKK